MMKKKTGKWMAVATAILGVSAVIICMLLFQESTEEQITVKQIPGAPKEGGNGEVKDKTAFDVQVFVEKRRRLARRRRERKEAEK